MTSQTSETPEIFHGDLVTWVNEHEEDLIAARDRLFPALISHDELKRLAPTDVQKRQPAGLINPKNGLAKQSELIAGVRHQIEKRKPALVLVKQGGGKTFITAEALRPFIKEAWAKGEKFRTVIICPKHLMLKWKRELEWSIPGLTVLVAERIEDLDPTRPRIRPIPATRRGRMTAKRLEQEKRRAERPHPIDADVILIAYNDASLSAHRIPVAHTRPFTVRGFNGKRQLARNSRKLDKNGKPLPHFILHCPECGKPLTTTSSDGTITYLQSKDLKNRWRRCEAPKTHLDLDADHGTEIRIVEGLDESGNLHKFVYKYKVVSDGPCNAPLWQYTAAMPEYSVEANTIALEARREHDDMRSRPDPLVAEDLQFKASGPRKMDLATFLTRHYIGYVPEETYQRDGQGRIIPGTGKPLRIDEVVIDEAHMTKAAESARGMAAANIAAKASRSVILLTATVTGGYASSLFYLLWRFSPRIREYFNYDEVERFVSVYGVRSMTYKTKEDGGEHESYQIGRMSRRRAPIPTMKELPGFSPAGYPLLWYFTVFAELAEIFPDLPEYEDLVDFIDLDDTHETVWNVPLLNPDGTPKKDELGQPIFHESRYTQKRAYEYIRSRLEGEAKLMLAMGDKGLLAAMLQTLLRWPNIPTQSIEIMHPRTGDVVVAFPGLDPDFIYPKERALAEQIIKDAREGHKSIVFVTHTGQHDVSMRIEKVIRQVSAEMGHRVHPCVMRSSDVSPIDREEWIAKKVAGSDTEAPIDVLICNPRLVDTGLDLVAFSRTHFVELDYSIYVMAQASRRTLRPGQTKDVLTRYWVYNQTLETGASKLMAMKARELGRISGSDLTEAFMEQAGAPSLQEWLMQQLTRGMKDAMATKDEVQSEMKKRTQAEKQERKAMLRSLNNGQDWVVTRIPDDEEEDDWMIEFFTAKTSDGALDMPGVILKDEPHHLTIATPMTPDSPAPVRDELPKKPTTWDEWRVYYLELEAAKKRRKKSA